MKKDKTVNINQTKHKRNQLKGYQYLTLTPFIAVFSHYREKGLEYIMRRNMIPQWKPVHEGVLRFLDQFVVTEQPKTKTED
jgi:hypothetical protein